MPRGGRGRRDSPAEFSVTGIQSGKPALCSDGAEVGEDPGSGHSGGEVPGENGGRVLQERTQQRPGGEQRVAGAGAGDTKGWGGDTRPGLHCLTRPTLGRQ